MRVSDAATPTRTLRVTVRLVVCFGELFRAGTLLWADQLAAASLLSTAAAPHDGDMADNEKVPLFTRQM
ncbi:MAG: hypothetical protein JWR83_723, partial [Aeromicrobium sp.]|nr:hypothetical protein [Aeromicrobium sp.]